MRRHLFPAVRMLLALTVLTGLAYPLVVTAAAQLIAPQQASGSLIEVDGQAVGSALQGQPFSGDDFFHPRPSAAGDGYDASDTGGSNAGPTNAEFLALVERRVADYRTANDLPADTPVPVDAVTASGSGMDPHISVANARLQASRVAHARGLALDDVLRLVEEHTQPRAWGVLGEPAVHVLRLNLALESEQAGA